MRLCHYISIGLFFLLILTGLEGRGFQQKGKVKAAFTSRTFTLSDGLPGAHITTLMQDSRGFLWIGTKKGLARWDGRTIKSFALSSELSRQVFVMAESPTGAIFVSFNACPYFAVIEGDRPRIVSLPNHFNSCMVDHFAFRSQECIELVCRPWGTQKSLPGHALLEWNGRDFSLNAQWKGMNAIFVGRNADTFWFGEVKPKNNQAVLVHRAQGKQTIFWADSTLLPDQFIHLNVADANGQGKGYLFRKEDKLFHLQIVSGLNGHYFHTKFLCQTDVPTSVLLPVVGAPGWYCIGARLGYVDSLGHFQVVADHLPPSIFALRDRDGNFWLGTEMGLITLFCLGVRSLTFDFEPGVYDEVWSMTKNSSGQFFLASYRFGFFQADPSLRSWSCINKCIPLQQSQQNENWLKGTYGAISGADRVTMLPMVMGFTFLKDKEMVYWPIASGGEIYAAAAMPADSHRIFILHYTGLYTVDTRLLQTKKILSVSDVGQRFFIHMILDSAYQPVLLGSDGMIRYASGRAEILTDTMTGLCSTCDPRGNIWVGGRKRKIFVIRNGKPTRIPALDFVDLPSSMTIWNRRWLVVGTLSELVFFNLDTYYAGLPPEIVRVGSSQGLNMLEGGQNSFLHNQADSSIFWCCSDKVIQFFPDRLLHRVVPPPPTVLDIRAVNVQDVQVMAPDLTSAWEVGSDFRQLVFCFSSPLFSKNEYMEYAYFLKGYDKKWHRTTTTELKFGNLSSGTYQLFLKALVKDGKESPVSMSRPVIIRPFFYETGLFQGMIIVLFLASFGGLIYWFIRRQRIKQFRRLLRSKDRVEGQLQLVRSRFTTHFSGNVYNAIVHLLEQGREADAIEYLLKFSRLNADVIRNAEYNVRTLAQELKLVQDYLSLEKLRFRDRLVYQVVIDPKADLNIPVPMMLLHTFAENAVKHGLMSTKGHGEIAIHIQDTPGGVLLRVEDDGIGFDSAAKAGSGGTQAGLSTLLRQIELMNQANKEKIAVEIKDRVDVGLFKGTRVTIFIPVMYAY